MKHLDLETLHLEAGGHAPDSQFCMMEAVAYFAHEAWSDHPKCVSLAIGAFLRSWNDGMSDDDRQKLKPYIPKVIGTATIPEAEDIRGWMATDWLVRVFSPAWLRLAGLEEHAASMEQLPELRTAELAAEAMGTIDAAKRAAEAAWAAEAAGAAWAAEAAEAAWAARAAGAAWAAEAAEAAWAARAAGAAEVALRPTVVALQESAFELLDRMIDVDRNPVEIPA